MMFEIPAFNLVALGIAALVHVVLGALWYSPLLFGRYWMKLMNYSPDMMDGKQKEAMVGYGVSIIASILTAGVLATAIYYFEAYSLIEGAIVGVLLWLGFVATSTISNVLWEGKKVQLYLVYNLYQVVSLAIMGALIGWMS